jgi:hypothetical protein
VNRNCDLKYYGTKYYHYSIDHLLFSRNIHLTYCAVVCVRVLVLHNDIAERRVVHVCTSSYIQVWNDSSSVRRCIGVCTVYVRTTSNFNFINTIIVFFFVDSLYILRLSLRTKCVGNCPHDALATYYWCRNEYLIIWIYDKKEVLLLRRAHYIL